MRLQLIGPDGQAWRCDTHDLAIAAAWIKSWMPLIVSADAAWGRWSLQIFPTSDAEMAIANQAHLFDLTETGLGKVEAVFRDAREHLARKRAHKATRR